MFHGSLVEPLHKGLVRAHDGHILSLDSSGILQFKWNVTNESSIFEISKDGELLNDKGDRVYWIQDDDENDERGEKKYWFKVEKFGPNELFLKAFDTENNEVGKYLTIKLEGLTLKDQASTLSEFIITKEI
ncbi:6238_t:CDS:2 [Scutellospora calospora]|uniref:6238_t:CDS:1 n=1 Tax=Scutellospora calospora TaxID=85575 RepID=A0ACA9JU16_9GLOM|nr:6238_t:CDS:2 [Scutellospora calospora]